jgi:hypothetical protein
VAALALTTISGLVAWNQWQQLGREYPGEATGSLPNSRALASGGVLMNAMFFLVILTQALVEIILGACE